MTAFGSITANPLCLYHGGKLKGAVEVRTNAKSMAYGPGLYMTTAYWTAREYRGGNGYVYRICLSPDLRWAHQVVVPLDEALQFISEIPKLKRRTDVTADLRKLSERRDGKVSFVGIMNTLDIHSAFGAKVAQDVAAALVRHGVDATLVTGANGGGEDWIVLHNPAKVRSVTTTDGPEPDMPRIPEVHR